MPGPADLTHILLSNIPRAPKRTDTSTLRAILAAAGIERTPRAVQMKLQQLAGHHPIRCIETSKPYQWQWMPEAPEYEYPAMGPHVALTLKMADAYLAHLLPRATLAALKSRLQRADAVLRSPGRRKVSVWQDKIRVLSRGLPLQPPNVDRNVIAVVYDALLEDKRFAVNYLRRGARALEHWDVNPLGLVVRGSLITVIGTIYPSTDVRMMHLHRMRNAELLPSASRAPADFDLDRFVAEGNLSFRLGKQPVRLVLLVDPMVGQTLDETPLSADQKKTDGPAGRIRVEATVPDTLDLQGWIKSYGPLIEVVKPTRLRRTIASDARRMAGLYARD